MAKQSVAVWDKEKSVARVIHSKGKYIQHMGFGLDKSLCLFPEEVMFLVLQGELSLFEDHLMQKELTQEEMWQSVLVQSGVDIDVYYVYAQLRQNRFHVYRVGFHASNEPCTLRVPSAVTEAQCTFAFDVYSPMAKFSKAKMQIPDSVVMICRSNGEMPAPTALAEQQSTLHTDTKVLLAIVDPESSAHTSFVEVSKLDVPVMIESAV